MAIVFSLENILAQIHIVFPKCTEGGVGGGGTGLGIIPKKYHFFTASLQLELLSPVT